MITEWHHFVVSCPTVINTPHHYYHCTLSADSAENWITWVTWQKQRLYTFSLCLATTFYLSLVLPSLFVPLSHSHSRLPVYVRRASNQSAVKAVILLVAIYYPVVCLKKDWKRAKLNEGCWVSRHAKLQSESATDLYTFFALQLMKVCFF